jgi:alanyl-tRNA synthetase
MLGNFSFGDYFKEDAIKFAWDLLVNEYKLNPARMWFSVFEGDDEVGPDEDAEKFWEQVGAPRERILRFGKKDNFWQMGETGPCGPCSEIHYYMGDDPSDAENCAANVNGPGDTITEIWNLVFMQFDRSASARIEPGGGKLNLQPVEYELKPLPKPSVDTGMGLERLCVVLQGVKSNYETDLLKDLIEFIAAEIADHVYEPHTIQGYSMRVVSDHARATAFSIADGIMPGNEGRNYVLRKIMRRAIFHGRRAFFLDEPFFFKVTNRVVDLMGEAYPELEASRSLIEKIVRLEEQRFGTTLTVGLQKLDAVVQEMDVIGVLSDFTEVARIYDTYGVPRDLIRQALEDELRIIGGEVPQLPSFVGTGPDGKLTIEESKFNETFNLALKKLQRASGIGKTEQKTKTKPLYADVAARVQSLFRGYETTRVDDAKVLALISGDAEVSELKEGDDGGVVLDQTPFYAESGGQVGDVGRIVRTASGRGRLNSENRIAEDQPAATAAGSDLKVVDTYSPVQGLIIHKVRIEKGSIKVGDTVTAEVDVETRDATRRNHTATHLVHAALREVLGSHVKQAGSIVAPNYLRFDFTHYQPMTEDEMKEVERLVNEQVLRNVKVDTDVMPVEEAMKSGAMALFGEKYSGMMRVLTVPGFSKELCGGTHVRATGDIGVFKITSDESIASGVRRIRAITGIDAYERFREDEMLIESAIANLRTSRADLPNVIGKLQDELKKARREAEELKLKIASGAIVGTASNGDEAREVAGVKVLAKEASGLDAAGMRQLSDTLLARIKSGVVVIGRANDGKASLIVRTSDDLTKKVPAGQVIKELAPIIGGRGGGKADMAEGGGSQPERLGEALQASYGVIEKMLS